MGAADQEYFEEPPMNAPEEAERTYSYREKALRDFFVKEYLVDYNAEAAAHRIGYNKGIAKEYAVRLMAEPYVAQQIAKIEGTGDSEADPEALKKRIMSCLIREANDRGPGSSQAARVAALGKLAQLNGMEPATRTKTELTGADGQPLVAGQFVIPGVMTPEQWEAAAAQQQADLVGGKIAQVKQVAPPVVE